MFTSLHWGLKLEIITFLTLQEIYQLGCCNKSNFLLFLREKESRNSLIKSSSRFLSYGRKRETVCITSYPRCGNSFLRKLLENWCGIVTGADNHPYRTLSRSLLKCGYQGEGITDQSVWLIKTHYPERHGYKKYIAHRAILLIRNPFDAIQSYFHMGMTNTHNQTLTTEAFNSLLHIWQPFLENEIQIYSQFYRWWFQRAKPQTSTDSPSSSSSSSTSSISTKIPILLVRYEDLLADRDNSMNRIRNFLLSGKPPIGLNLLQNHTSTLNGEQASSAGYTPRVKKASPGSSLQTIYSSENIQMMMHHCGDVLDLAGYQIISEEPRTSLNGSSNMALHLVEPSFHSLHCEDSQDGESILMNETYSVRKEEDTYGRKITNLRKSLTNNDLEPFEIA